MGYGQRDQLQRFFHASHALVRDSKGKGFGGELLLQEDKGFFESHSPCTAAFFSASVLCPRSLLMVHDRGCDSRKTRGRVGG